MAYTIIEVEKLTGISSHTLRFWAKKGLFPFVEKDKNGVKYFSTNDLEWASWIECFRSTGMSIENIKEYINLCTQGIESASKRRDMILAQQNVVASQLDELKRVHKKLVEKVKFYDEMIEQNKDYLNPQSKGYKKPICKS